MIKLYKLSIINKLLIPIILNLVGFLAIGNIAFANKNTQNSQVVVTIKPLHSLVAAVMEGTGSPTLLVNKNDNVHDYNFKPSQMKFLNNAKIVFLIDYRFENFLQAPLENISHPVSIVEMTKAPAIDLLKPRTETIWTANYHQIIKAEIGQHHDNDHHDDHIHSHHQDLDPHLWMSPYNAVEMTRFIAFKLGKIFPENKALYRRNADKTVAKLLNLNKELTEQLKPVQNKYFYVYHDAFQYIERAYKLSSRGAITLEPELSPSAKRIKTLRDNIKPLKITCVLSEPQFNTQITTTVIGGFKVKTNVIDEAGANLNPGPNLYFDLIRNSANAIESCLK